MDVLLASLLDLLHALEGRDIPITVGGGFGLYLKRHHLMSTGQPTLFAELPEPRSTNDLDLFLRAEVIADLDRTRQVEKTIRQLGYTVVEEAKFLQWKREVLVGNVNQQVKIDILVGPFAPYRNKLRIKMPRVRPKGAIQFHAHAVEEAIHLEDEPVVVALTGNRSNGEPYKATVHVPQAFPYLLMKLHAFADRKDDSDKDLGRHHALDLYTIIAMMTENEYERAKELGTVHAADDRCKRACEIVRDHFPGKSYGPPVARAPRAQHSLERDHYAGATALGILRIREHPLFREEFPLEEFASVLEEIFIGS